MSILQSLVPLLFFSSVSLAIADNIEVVEFDFNKKPITSKLPTNERFYLVHKESLLFSVDYNSLGRFEKRIGSLKKKSENDIRFEEISKFPEFDLNRGDKIQFYNSKTKKREVHQIKEREAFRMIRSPFDDENVYASFNLVLTDPSSFYQFDHLDIYKFENVAFKGSALKLKAGTMTKDEKKSIGALSAEGQVLLNIFLAKSTIPLKSTDVDVYEIATGEKKILQFRNKKNLDASYFLKINDKKYLSWKAPSNSEFAHFHLYGDVVEGAELSAVFEFGLVYYVILFFQDRIEAYPAWESSGGS